MVAITRANVESYSPSAIASPKRVCGSGFGLLSRGGTPKAMYLAALP